jgi:hypothetical protein
MTCSQALPGNTDWWLLPPSAEWQEPLKPQPDFWAIPFLERFAIVGMRGMTILFLERFAIVGMRRCRGGHGGTAPTPIFCILRHIPIAQIPIAQIPIAQIPIAQIPIAQIPIAQIPIAQTPIAQIPIAQIRIAQIPYGQCPRACPTPDTPIAPLRLPPIAKRSRNAIAPHPQPATEAQYIYGIAGKLPRFFTFLYLVCTIKWDEWELYIC